MKVRNSIFWATNLSSDSFAAPYAMMVCSISFESPDLGSIESCLLKLGGTFKLCNLGPKYLYLSNVYVVKCELKKIRLVQIIANYGKSLNWFYSNETQSK